MKKNISFTVGSNAALLPFLIENLKGESRNNIKSLLKRGQITVDGNVCKNHAYALCPEQQIEVVFGVPPANVKPAFPILFEDNDFIVIEKPAGLLAVSTEKEREKTAYHIITDYVKLNAIAERVFIVHRLDREASGVMLFAKKEHIKKALQVDWDNLVTQREYYAVAEGKVVPEKGSVKSWLKQTKTLLVYSSNKENDGKQAVTNYKTVKSTDSYSLLDISLETGRKNQIRVHMHDIGHPLAGDKKYGARTNPFGRLGLHASRLEVMHPFTGVQMLFVSKMPSVFNF